MPLRTNCFPRRVLVTTKYFKDEHVHVFALSSVPSVRARGILYAIPTFLTLFYALKTERGNERPFLNKMSWIPVFSSYVNISTL